MSHACTSVLVGVASTVSEIQKQPNFSFGPWSSENLINWNRLKKLMLVGIDVNACITILVGVAFLVLEIPLPSKMAKFHHEL